MTPNENVTPRPAKHPPVKRGVQGFIARPAAERFWERVEKPEDPNGCWLWIGGTTGSSGYGRFTLTRAVSITAHRWSYEQHDGPIDEGLVIDHLCRVRLCVNPAHLEPVTNRENILRGVSVVAKQAAQTTCAKGHPFDTHNGRQRVCLTCQREAGRRYKQRQREKRRAS